MCFDTHVSVILFVQGDRSFHHLLFDSCHRALRDTLPSRGGPLGRLRVATPSLPRPAARDACELLQKVALAVRPHSISQGDQVSLDTFFFPLFFFSFPLVYRIQEWSILFDSGCARLASFVLFVHCSG